jgi:peptide methionine sulfoxide reductase MsrB
MVCQSREESHHKSMPLSRLFYICPNSSISSFFLNLVAGYFLTTSFLSEIRIEKIKDLTFFDSNTGLPLFLAPRGRTLDDFLTESRNFGWLRFRTEEVLWNNVHLNESCGELVSKDGTHLGHVLPDPETHEPRYMINIVSIAGRPTNSLVEV